ncbi:MAG TPA: PAS domain-containing protein [Abditibacteriaceae bacterium]|jgi:PAS domain S-box-containing protein
MSTQHKRLITRYGVALLAVCVAVALTRAVPLVASRTPFLLFFAAVAVSAWFGGFGPGLCATVLAVATVNYLFIAPRGHFSFSFPDVLLGSVFFGVSALISYLTATQRASSEALQASEQQFELALDAAGMGDWQWDIPTDVLHLSPRIKEICGLPPDSKITFVDFADIIHADDRQRVRSEVEEAIGAHTPYDFEYRIVRTDGSIRWLAVRGRAVYDASGAPQAMAGVAMDATARRQREEERRVLEERFRLMADSAPVKIWVCDANNHGTWFNKRWLEFTGRSMEQELGTGWTQSLHPDDFQEAVQTCGAAIERREPFTMEFRMRRHDGQYRWVVDSGVPLYGVDGTFTGYIGSAVDITTRKEAEVERQQALLAEQEARAEAERINRMKDEFMATLSHELRTPLNAIMGWSHLISSGHLGPEEARQGIETIERNARLQTHLIEDLLDMSRIVSGKIRLDVQRVDLASVVEAAIESVQPAAEAKGIRLQKVLDPLPGPISGDPGRLQQVLWNLLMNAVKFTPQDGRVQIVLEHINSHVEITVSDNGQGIRPEFLPHVFDRFRQEDASTTRRHGGLGLGLGIAKNLVELHGGTIRARSPGEGRGATFIVTLPLSVAREAPRMEEKRKPRAPHEQGDFRVPDLRGLKVLVVDDEADARDLIKRLLEECGVSVISAGTAAQALQYLQQEKPAVLLSDIGMPGEDGYALIAQVRALPAQQGGSVPAIALTAFARTEDRRRTLLAGFQMHLAKPVEPAELVTAVANVAGFIGRSTVRDDGSATANA